MAGKPAVSEGTGRRPVSREFIPCPRSTEPVTGRHGGTFLTFGDYSVSLYKHAPQHGEPPFRSFFDVGAVAVVKNPAWADAVEMPCPQLKGPNWVDRPDNPLKMILWENFDSAAIMADFFNTMGNWKN
jgi:purine nucleosidase